MRQKTLPPVTSENHCVGCGAEFAKSKYIATYHSYAIMVAGAGKEFKVCRNGTSTNAYPRESCKKAALERLALCPGCSKPGYDPGRLCTDCQTLIERANLQPADTKPYKVIPAALFEYLEHDLHSKAAKVLTDMLGGASEDTHYANNTIPEKTTHSSGYSDPVVFLSDKQAAAVKEFVSFWQFIFNEQRAVGRERGHSFILDLAEGRVSLEEFNKRDAAVRQAAGEAEEDVRKLRFRLADTED